MTRINLARLLNIEAFQRYCAPCNNILYKRYGFWNLRQEDDESIDVYLTRIKIKIDMCEYIREGWPPTVQEELMRDKFLFGLIDDNLKERLLREPNLDLTRALEIAQQSKALKLQVKEMGARSTTVNALRRNKPQQRVSSPDSQRVTQCGQCGRQHRARECPAYGQQCSYCHKLNHYARMCRNRQNTEFREQLIRSQGLITIVRYRKLYRVTQASVRPLKNLQTSLLSQF